jgi:hypothetical protein
MNDPEDRLREAWAQVLEWVSYGDDGFVRVPKAEFEEMVSAFESYFTSADEKE